MRRVPIVMLVFFMSLSSFAQNPPGTLEPPRPAKPKEEPRKEVITKRPVVVPVPEVPGAIRLIRIIATTGSDDLRRDSELRAFLLLKDGRRIESLALNCRKVREETVCPSFPNGSRRTLEWRLDPPAPPVSASDIHRFGLSFKSGRSGPFDTGDNWNLNRLEVEYVVTSADPTRGITAGTFPLLKLTEQRVHRFKTNETWESEPIVLAPETR